MDTTHDGDQDDPIRTGLGAGRLTENAGATSIGLLGWTYDTRGAASTWRQAAGNCAIVIGGFGFGGVVGGFG